MHCRGDRTREQVFQGDIIRLSGEGLVRLTVRKISFGIGVERTFHFTHQRLLSLRFFATVLFTALSSTPRAIVLVRLLVFARSANQPSFLKPPPGGFFSTIVV